jgi:F-type H+-transporting ATPase subunit gamma
MAGSKEIKQRIKSVKNTKKITKAMELVAASKMKKAVASAMSSRLYSMYSWDLLSSLSASLREITHPFFTQSKNTKTLIVLISSNRGLCGAYNSQVIKSAVRKIKDLSGENIVDVDIVSIGKKGDSSMRRVGQNIIASFLDLPDTISLAKINPISAFITEEYRAGRYGKVYVAYTDFVSALSQKSNVRQLLPIKKEELRESIESVGPAISKENLNTKIPEYNFEGSREEIIESLSSKLISMQIYQMMLESQASEQSSRMLAMKNASEAAGEMISDLTLTFNKARQAGITREISEISAGMSSVN